MSKRLSLLLACLFMSIGMALAQTKVTGTVNDDSGEPIIGASVVVQGSKVGAVTNTDGQFTLTVPKGKKIVVSYLGMQSQIVTPPGKGKLTITLHADNQTLSEVVVTGMTSVDRRMFTGATDQIKADDAMIGLSLIHI